jgi:hypothetical protein
MLGPLAAPAQINQVREVLNGQMALRLPDAAHAVRLAPDSAEVPVALMDLGDNVGGAVLLLTTKRRVRRVCISSGASACTRSDRTS